MSRIANLPVTVPSGVDIDITPETIRVKGKLGTLEQANHASVRIERDGASLRFAPVDQTKQAHALTGTYRALMANMVKGVTVGFERRLNLVGVGYRAQAQGQSINLSLGFSHPVVHKVPDGVKAETPTQTEIVIKGSDKQKVGQVAAQVRAYRPPEPYKGKGVRYSDERIVLKETKKK